MEFIGGELDVLTRLKEHKRLAGHLSIYFLDDDLLYRDACLLELLSDLLGCDLPRQALQLSRPFFVLY